MSRDRRLREMSEHFINIAAWAVDATDEDVTDINEMLAKLAARLDEMKTAQQSAGSPDA